MKPEQADIVDVATIIEAMSSLRLEEDVNIHG